MRLIVLFNDNYFDFEKESLIIIKELFQELKSFIINYDIISPQKKLIKTF